ncbi:hypothetical protein BDY17DRAFT_321061 [Neohortaea acidophila]|uniref:Translation initiation factor 3 N-terminal domain-containing protein n=1 Tax=Neohortaea acidophila TaxID=245834 RepID=A0A6A6Q2M8_9PEZI|nr:uncharacterized protein BDY17DRAFT_321061 [Neohortaea acidophila]KAF2486249.1 hypothetical protein BDY17DRAFT_321061 [Neohortaea acidophila]
MATPRCTTTTSQALYRVFIAPYLPKQQPRPRPKLPSTYLTRSLTTTSRLHALHRAKAVPEQRRELWNEEITAKVIHLIDPATNTLLPRPQTRYDTLQTLNLETHRLIQIPGQFHPEDKLPICKIVSKAEVFEAKRRAQAEAKEKKKYEGAAKTLKTLELNWAMDGNDLGHKMGKVREFLTEGRKVEVVLAAKKRGRKASLEECEGVLKRIRETVEEVSGAREAREMEGKVGGFAKLLFHGRPLHRPSAAAAATE